MLRIAEEVTTALEEGRAVVALESTLISHGLPYPQNLEVATALEAAVRSSGAIPATIGVEAGVMSAPPSPTAPTAPLLSLLQWPSPPQPESPSSPPAGSAACIAALHTPGTSQPT